MRFYGIPETENTTESDGPTTEMVLRNFLEDVLDMYAVTGFQRVHRVGRVAADRDKPRPIIARFQKYPDVEILKKRRNLDRNDGYGIGPDLPKKVIELRKPQIPRMLLSSNFS